MAFGSPRVVAVQLRADVSGYVGNITKAQKATADFGRAVQQSAAKNKGDWTGLGMAVGGAGAAIGVGLGAAVAAAARFDKQMSAVSAATRASATEMAALRQAAIQAGADTAFSATEAAQGVEQLAKAGVSTADVLAGGLKGALDLAAAGSIAVGDAAEVAASAMTQFSLKGSEVPRVADLLAAAAGKAQGEVGDMAAALQQSGQVAAQMGLSIDDTVGALTLFARAGLTGSDAGTSFKQMLLTLTPQSEAASKMMDTLGLSFFDAQGKLKGFPEIAGELQDKLKDLSVEEQATTLKTIFGADAFRVAAIAMKGGSAAALDARNSIQEVGYASKTAEEKLNNLSGDLEKLSGSLETALIQSGSAANAALRGLVQGATSAVNAFGALPVPMQQAAFQAGALSAGVLLVGGGLLTVIPRIVETKAAMTALGLTTGRTAVAMKGLAAGISIIGVASLVEPISKGVGEMGVAKIETDKLAESLRGLGRTGAITADGLKLFQRGADWSPFRKEITTTDDAMREFGDTASGALRGGFSNLFQGDFSALDQFLGRMQDGGAIVGRFEEQTRQVDGALAELVSGGRALDAKLAFDQFTQAAVDQGVPLAEITAKFPQYAEAAKKAAEADRIAAPAAVQHGVSVLGLDKAAEAAKASIQALSDAVTGLSAQFSLQAAEDAVAASLNGLKDAAKGANRELRGNSEATLRARGAMRELVTQNLQVIDTMIKGGATQGEVAAKARALAREIDKTGHAAGLSKTATQGYSQVLRDVPKTVATAVKAEGIDAALAAVSAFTTRLAVLNGKVVKIRVRADSANERESRYAVPQPAPRRRRAALTTSDRHGLADGGLIPLGWGGPREDNVPILASSGEFVVNAAATRQHLPMLRQINARRFADGGQVGRYADGGQIPVAQFLARFDGRPGQPVTPEDLLKATTRQRQAVDAVRVAELKLEEVRKRKGRTASQVAAAEATLAKRRDAVAAATRRLSVLETRQSQQKARAGLSPLGRFAGALAGGVRDAAAFVRNVETIASRGYGRLAQQLAEMGDEEAERIAASAAKASDQSLRQVTGQLRSAAGVQGQVASLGDSARILSAVAGGGGSSLKALSSSTGLGYQNLIAALAFVKDRLAKDPRAKGVLADLAKYAATGSFAAGGLIAGPGSGTSDSVLLRGSAGEYVVKAAAVQKYGVRAMDDLNAMRWASDRVTAAPAGGMAGATYGGDTLIVQADGPLIAQSARALADAVVTKKARADVLRSRRRP